MVDRRKDREDKMLEALFRSDPVPDNGFSARVMTRVNRRIWVRRLALPAAFVVGGIIAVKPLSQLAVTFSKFLVFVPSNFGGLTLESIPQASTIVLGGLLLAAMMMITKMLEE